ncbi:MAG TPA: LodA/GoxA family CTQ-dependent oxidase [Candidatus Angelobacter sp.]|nr:LodA/GoxA family CTQ-dependent oxidase [Candidatus Angelobacter sp.]
MNACDAIPKYRIHPGIGIARLGDSPDEFCISPETPAALPIACDRQGNPLLSPDGKSEVRVTNFKDPEGRIKRQAARFHIYVYDEQSPGGQPIKIGDPVEGGGNHGVLVDIQWRVYLANKKSVWFQFDALKGERGYDASHPRRNSDITDPEARQRLIIDPGPQIVNCTDTRQASFSRSSSGLYAPVFPPPLQPRSIDTLGDILTADAGHLLVLGGHGRSGTFLAGFGQPRIEEYANNDGWFDDVSDGPVMARLVMFSTEVGRLRFIDVEYPAWVLVGYPAYVPQVLDIVTLNDVICNTAITEFADRTDIYGIRGTFDHPDKIDPNDTPALLHWKAGSLEWNPDYKPWFYRDIWPVLFRADEFSYLASVLAQSNFPHNQSARGNFDPDKLSIPPYLNQTSWHKRAQQALRENQSGELLIESLESTLILLDDQAKNSLRARREPHLLAAYRYAAGKRDVRKALKDAFGNFADAVNPDPQLNDPEAYLARWKQMYAQSGSGNDTPEIRRYREAEEQLQKVVDQVITELSGAVKAERPVLKEAPRSTFLMLRRAESATIRGHGTNQASEPIESTLERYFSEFRSGKLLEGRLKAARAEATYDPYYDYRNYLFDLLRQPGEENEFRLGGKPNSRTHNLPLMPLLAGDNPLSNHVPTKFLRLTDYQLYLLRQWAEGKFYNEILEGWTSKEQVNPFRPFDQWVNRTARELDEGVLTNLLGGAFCPGGEVCWIIRNPSIYVSPYRIKADSDFYNFRQTAANANANSRQEPVSEEDYVSSTGSSLSQGSNFERGLQPGDLTKYSALPWQADFNECSIQPINITYEQWNTINPASENDQWMRLEGQVWDTLWWPAHRPMQTYEVVGFTNGSPIYQYLNWSRGVPQTNAGDLKMVTEWSRLGFVVRNPYVPEDQLDAPSPDTKYISVERNQNERSKEE